MRVYKIVFAVLLAHSWYPDKCCGGGDCHPVPCSELTSTEDGVIWQGLPLNHFGVFASQDDQCHVCVHQQNPGAGRVIYCAFIQKPVS